MPDQSAELYLWDSTNNTWVRAVADTNGKLIISDADPFTIQQTTPTNLLHVPYGYEAGGEEYLPNACNWFGAKGIGNPTYDADDLRHAPFGYDYANVVYRAIAVDSSGRQLVVTYPKKVAAHVYHDANQSIPDSTFTTLAFNSERVDTDGQHDNVTNNSRLTCKVAGFYIISVGVDFAANANGRRVVRLRLNNTTDIMRHTVPATAAGALNFPTPVLYDLAVNDYIEVIVWQNSGGALNVQASANYSPEFAFAMLGSTA